MTDASTARPVLSGRYELHRRIARGGMADVFLARDQLLDRPVAVKVLFPQYAAEPTFVARFRREAQAAANLNHPSIVAVYDWGAHEDTYFIVMEYVEGRSLADVLAAEGHLYPDRAAEVATDVAAALGFAHRNGTVHRDVKPGNIMITPSGQVKVTDFGIARAFGGNDEELTQTGSVMGTASYFSPEQAQGKQVDPRSDLYSLGVVLFEMVTGQPPFTGSSPTAIAYKHVQEPAPAASSLNMSVPPALDAIIAKLLSKNPDHRYPAAEDVRADLRRFREGQPLSGVAPNGMSSNGATVAMAMPQNGHHVGTELGDTGSGRAVIDTTRAVPASAAVRQAEPVEEYYEPPSRTGVFIIMLAGLLLLLFGLVYYIYNEVNSETATEDTVVEVDLERVPRVIGESERSAQNSIEDALLVPVVELVVDDEAEPGTVIDQQPEGGAEVEAGTEVIIFVVENEPKIVPPVVGSNKDEATAVLEDLGFLVEITFEESDTFEKDIVIEQTPAGGQSANPGTNVTLIVSGGPAQATVPDLFNKTQNEANILLGQAGFGIGNVVIEFEANAEVAEGSVIRSDPPAQSQVDLESTITIYVSSGSDNQEVPPVISLTQEAAELALRERGFNIRVELIPVDPNSGQVGVVITQSPEAGQFQPLGAEIIIRVGVDNTPTTQPDDGGGGGDGGGGDDNNDNDGG